MTSSRGRRLGVAIAAMLAVGACAKDEHGGTWEQVQARGELTWGSDIEGGAPYIFGDPDDADRELGFEVDLAEALAKRLGVEARRVQSGWSNLVPSLERGDFDIILNGLEDTPIRRERLRLSRPYYVYGETLSVREGSQARTLEDLAGQQVGTLNQTVAYDLLRASDVELKIYESNEMYAELANGRLAAVLLDHPIADRYGCTMAGIYCVPEDLARGTYVVGIRREDPELQVAVDDALAAMSADGELERILTRWKLWDHRQTEPVPALELPAPSSAHGFGGAQLELFARAALVTIQVSVLSYLLAVPLGLLLAVGRVYGGSVASAAARVYIEVFRGTPVLLQLYVLYYGLAPYYAFSPMTAAVLGLGLNYAAYEAEVYRGALLALPRGQTEAAKALGLGPWQTLRHVLLPQAFRLALPPMTNDFVSLLKDSSLISVIAVIELTKQMTISSSDLQGYLIPGLACAAFYLALSLPLSELARRLERRLTRDQRPAAL